MDHGGDRGQPVVSEIRVYVEGGGDGKETKRAMRRGFSQFLGELREAAQQQRVRWSIIACGSRNATFDGFETATRDHPEAFNILLVDAEQPVECEPLEHLRRRDQKRVRAKAEECHLMVQIMEAWLVADRAGLGEFYGQGFLDSAIPPRDDVESIPKRDLLQALMRATHQTQKGDYHKIWHAAELLGHVDPGIVRSKAPHCRRLFQTVLNALESD